MQCANEVKECVPVRSTSAFVSEIKEEWKEMSNKRAMKNAQKRNKSHPWARFLLNK